MNYTELQVTTNFSFLRGASHPDELVDEASRLGYEKIAIIIFNGQASHITCNACHYCIWQLRHIFLFPIIASLFNS